MSGQESDSGSSCQYSDDSDINFIPGYVMEDAQAEKDCDSGEDEGCSGFAYAEEPLADEAWLETYHREEQQRLEAEEQFTKRLNCSVEISEWCKCGNCGVELLANIHECCCELEACDEALKNNEVLEDLKAEGKDIELIKCITQHPGFDSVCLQKWSLKLAADKYKTRSKSRYSQVKTQNRFLRSISYREFVRLVYGFLGNRRVPLPSCAYTAIRKAFPTGRDEAITGYAEESD
ncbi:Hypothetical predicted protein [Paramuricea clavata]|uniref:P2X purinoreceptor 7 intracellular domain-containing protein n=2 Tax=Paramuricea clavata TaxID=317549 RepID=A0A6S7G5T6_PARCT|nr:Hypothetical predicted protein [Paramuricea clavata]